MFQSFFYSLQDIHTIRCTLLVVRICFFFFKISLLGLFALKLYKSKKIPLSWFFLFIALFFSTFEDFSWIAFLIKRTLIPSMDHKISRFIVRIAWAGSIVMYQSLALFIDNFAQKPRISKYQIGTFIVSGMFCLYFLLLSVLQFNQPFTIRPIIEFKIMSFQTFYAELCLIPSILIYTWVRLYKNSSSKILKAQLKTLTLFFILPHQFFNLFNAFYAGQDLTADRLIVHIFSGFFLSVTLFYCLKKITIFRFLDVHDHVHSSDRFNFTGNFKNVLESLGSATTLQEVQLLTQRFFQEAFNISPNNTRLLVRTSSIKTNSDSQEDPQNSNSALVENFIGNHNGSNTPDCAQALERLQKTRIFIFDEIEYDNFYKKLPIDKTILSFMNEIHGDIFIPIYEDSHIIGYIIIDRNARPKKLYSDVERDEMIVFASYLSNTINLLQNRNLGELLKQRKDIIEELYLKHQEINQYKESIRSFLSNNEQGIGIIFYKNRKFICANEEAKKIISIEPNTQEGHPLSKALKRVATQTMLYKTTQKEVIKDLAGKSVVVSGIPHIDQHTILLTVHYPEMYDTIKAQIDAIKDPSDWDYLLYLETTSSGKLINQLIPSNGEIFLNFKIDLLKLALSKKALLLDLPEDDLISMVELLHHISLRETLHILELAPHVTSADIAIKLFGINPLYGTINETPLLEKLHKKGTLFIKNIHYLSKEGQENLAHFIRYGFYTVFKSNKKIQSDVRIICSSNQNLSALVSNGQFCQSLFNELRSASLSMPPLLTLPDQEMSDLVDGFTQQAITKPEFKNFLSLSDKDRMHLIAQKPVSLHELKDWVQQLLVQKAKKNEMYEGDEFDVAYSVTDPRLIEAARLGKHALKDPKILTILWHKFKNQNKIALFLGVNRSSVNRRCKEYDIM